MLPSHVQHKLDSLPTAPGVYVFEDRAGETLYVGKAQNLRSRVRSYFQPGNSDTRPFIVHLERELGDLTTFVVGNAKEAALLENEVIKQRQPRFNVKLKDDKDFLSIRVNPKDKWPRLSVVRRPRPDGARYFGPYDSATSARQTLRQINRFFQLRTCKDTDFRSRTRPCLQYQIKRCPAPCVKDVDRAEYLAQVELVGMFLEGRHDQLVEDLDGRMRGAAQELAFERAATYRDQLRAVERARTRQRIATVKDVDQDVLGLYRAGDLAEVALLEVRNGHLNRVRTFELDDVGLPDEELVASFVSEWYRRGGTVPDELLLPVDVEAAEGLEAWLGELRDKKMAVLVPKRGAKRRLLEMASENAEHAFREKARAREDLESRLKELQDKLRLPVPPRRIECIDISHIGGSDTVAAITALSDGELDKARYRTFRVKKAEGGDDFGAMYEVLSRRFRRAMNGEAGWELPDLLVVDGGKGQLNVARAAMRDLDLEGLPVVGLAKERTSGGETTRVERVFLPGQKNPVPLPDRGPARYFLTHLRDEAHRASNHLRKKVGKRRRMKSGLDDIPGVGKKTRQRLLKELGTLKAVKEADIPQLRAAGANVRQAEAIVKAFQSVDDDREAAERDALDNAFEAAREPVNPG
ncbi:MAG: excinuclease ABC subunit UvrC [Sandaracinaceae bacterium]